MGFEQDIALLSRVALFRDFTVEQLRLLAFGIERQWFNAGQELFSRGELSDGGYVVARGQIDIVAMRNNREIILDTCLEASLIGEMALIASNRRIATAVARVNSEVMFVPRALFHRMLKEYPEMAMMLHQRVSQNVERMMIQITKVGDGMENIEALEDLTGGRRNAVRIAESEAAEMQDYLLDAPDQADD